MVRACLLMGAVLFAVTIHFCCLTKVPLGRQGFPSEENSILLCMAFHTKKRE